MVTTTSPSSGTGSAKLPGVLMLAKAAKQHRGCQLPAQAISQIRAVMLSKIQHMGDGHNDVEQSDVDDDDEPVEQQGIGKVVGRAHAVISSKAAPEPASCAQAIRKSTTAMLRKGQHLCDGHDDIKQNDIDDYDEPVEQHGISTVACNMQNDIDDYDEPVEQHGISTVAERHR